MESKTCRSCGEELPIYQFHVKADGEFGRNNKCKDCIRASRGQKRRMPPKPKQNDFEEITFELLVEDVFEEERRHPSDWHIRHVANTLRKNPRTTSEAVADMLYVMWERRLKHQDPSVFDGLDEHAPVMNRNTERGRRKRKTSLTPFIEYELV